MFMSSHGLARQSVINIPIQANFEDVFEFIHDVSFGI